MMHKIWTAVRSILAVLAGFVVALVLKAQSDRNADWAETSLEFAHKAVDEFLLEAGIQDLKDEPLPGPARRSSISASVGRVCARGNALPPSRRAHALRSPWGSVLQERAQVQRQFGGVAVTLRNLALHRALADGDQLGGSVQGNLIQGLRRTALDLAPNRVVVQSSPRGNVWHVPGEKVVEHCP